MKTSGQVVHHLRQRVFRAQKKYLSFYLKRASYNCQYNVLTRGNYKHSEDVSSCVHPEYAEEVKLSVEVGKLTRVVNMSGHPPCNDENTRYLECPNFTPRKSKAELQVEFQKSLLEKSKNPAEIAESHPDIAQLLWVLGVESLESLDSLSEPEIESQPTEPDPEESISDTTKPDKELADELLKVDDLLKEGDDLLKEGVEALLKDLACIDNEKKSELDVPALSTMSGYKTSLISEIPTSWFPTWLSWFWKRR